VQTRAELPFFLTAFSFIWRTNEQPAWTALHGSVRWQDDSNWHPRLGSSRAAQQPPAEAEHCYAVYGKNPSAKQKAAREDKLKSGKKAPMANRRMVGLLKMMRNVYFAHRSQNVQVCDLLPQYA
jgi:hypothetical protein